MNFKAVAWWTLSLTLVVALRARAEELLVIAVPAPATVQSKGEKQPADDKVKPAVQKAPAEKLPPEKTAPEAPATDVFTQAPGQEGEISSGFNPHMMGDQFGVFALQRVPIFGVQTTTKTVITQQEVGQKRTVTTSTKTITDTAIVRVPVAVLGGFNIAENASPRPVDRVFFTYNYYGDVTGPQTPASVPQFSSASSTTATFFTATNVSTSTVIPGAPPPRVNLNREVIGFEKTFLGGYASVEVRAPFLQVTGGGFSSQTFGYMTAIGKYAFLLDNTTGNVVSGGLAVTVPTGPAIPTIFTNFHSPLLQPWGGYIWNFNNRWFVQGFSSVVVPTDSSFPTLLFNDIGMSYWLYRATPDRPLSFIVPTLEAHVIDPLSQRGADSPIVFPDTVIMTGGVHFGMFRNGVMSLGVATPVTGPRIFNIEAFAQLNWRF